MSESTSVASSPSGDVDKKGADAKPSEYVNQEKSAATEAVIDDKVGSQSVTEKNTTKSSWFSRKKAKDTGNSAVDKENQARDKLEEELEKLDPADREVLLKQIKVESGDYINYLSLFRYATKWDIFLIGVAYIASIVEGAALPLYTLVFGGLTQEFTNFFTSLNPDKVHFQKMVDHYTLYFLYLGIGIIVLGYIAVYILVERGELLTSRIRQQYLRGILRQNIAYFDKLGVGFITTQLVTETDNIQKGISEKVSTISSGIATFVCAIIIAFIKSWKLTLILISALFCIITTVVFFLMLVIKYVVKMQEEYSKGAIVADEAISSIRNTVAFAAQERLAIKFEKSLSSSSVFEKKHFLALAFMIACNWGFIFFMYALAFWEGSRLIASGEINVGTVVTVILSMLIGSFVFTNVAPAFKSVAEAISGGRAIFPIIDRVSPIDSLDTESGVKLDEVKGHITFEHIRFIYPSRPSVTVLHDFNLEVLSGETVALVGLSGSGKSTIIGLLERFYEPLGGCIKIDGTDIMTLNTKWLRQNIALVSQEPTLFSVSIYENICYGLVGTPYENASDDVKLKMVEDACKEANAWDFIQGLSQGLETNVGDGGFLLSGGQKQRIAIARAIISNPKILLLDEATSALDTKSEGIVQEALDKASKSRTTIVIAHRLSTIKDADKIVVMSAGNVIEVGKHQELIAKGGAYFELVEAQKISRASKSDSASGSATTEDGDDEDDEDVKLLVQEDEDLSKLKKEGTLTSIEVREMSGLDSNKSVQRSPLALLRMLLRLTPNTKGILIIGLIAAVLAGMGFPANSMLFAVIVNALMVRPDQYPKMRHTLNAMSGYYFMLGVIIFFLFIIQLQALSVLTVRMVYAVRSRLFRHLLRMDIAFFDKDENSPGALVSKLGTYGNSIRGLGGTTIGQILQAFAMLVACIIIAIAWDWRVGLVGLSMVPLLLGCGFARVWVLNQLEIRSSKIYENSGSYASENVSAIRTVLSLTREEGISDKYSDMIFAQVKKSRRQIFWSAILFALAKGLAPWIMGLVFWYGTTLMKNYTITVTQFFVAFSAIVFGAQTSATIFSYAPDMGSARVAAQGFSEMMDQEPNIDYLSTDGEILQNVEGDIEFSNVHFRYPTRPSIPVLRGLNLSVKKGQYIALVGSSGCGKSTTISLIERFYNCQKGSIFLDGHDISTLNLAKYRENIALVQQEPVLYSGSIKENIILGAIDESKVTDEEIYEAARKANIHDFISSLPEGYDTACGAKGLLLSGGQKQRVAIARALIRNPKILLLDEATSALDSESEKIVQTALDEASKGRTTIAVAHRLSTIQKADVIYVFDKGVIIESGKHDELLALNGRYSELVALQSL